MPVVDRVFFVPEGTRLEAPAGKVIITEGPDGKVEVHAMDLPYKGVVIQEGYFLLLMREAMEKSDFPIPTPSAP